MIHPNTSQLHSCKLQSLPRKEFGTSVEFNSGCHLHKRLSGWCYSVHDVYLEQLAHGIEGSGFGDLYHHKECLGCSSRWLSVGNSIAFSFPDYQSCSSVVLLLLFIVPVEGQQIVYYSTVTVHTLMNNCEPLLWTPRSIFLCICAIFIQLSAGIHTWLCIM